jgi:hypothetical protein
MRSLAAASLIVASGAAGTLAVSALPAGAVNNNQITVYVTDNGFSQTNIVARVGDQLTFQLDGGATRAHTLAWEDGQIHFSFQRPGREYVNYGPLRKGPTIRFYDSDSVPGPDAPAPFAGTLTVTDAPPPPPDTTSSSTSTTVTTVRPTTTTHPVPVSSSSTTTLPPTTATSGPATIHPFLISAPPPAPTTTTTTTAPKKKDPPPDKGKGKAASPATPTTATPAPPAPPGLEPVFDPATLTPAPLPQPDSADPAAAATAENVDAEAVANLLNPDKPADNGTPMMLAAVVGLGLFLVAGGVWRWHHRASRYFPA